MLSNGAVEYNERASGDVQITGSIWDWPGREAGRSRETFAGTRFPSATLLSLCSGPVCFPGPCEESVMSPFDRASKPCLGSLRQSSRTR
jgi:hypothetical protein